MSGCLDQVTDQLTENTLAALRIDRALRIDSAAITESIQTYFQHTEGTVKGSGLTIAQTSEAAIGVRAMASDMDNTLGHSITQTNNCVFERSAPDVETFKNSGEGTEFVAQTFFIKVCRLGGKTVCVHH